MLSIIMILMLSISQEYPLPGSAVKALDSHYGEWQIMNPRKEDEQYETNEYSFYRCNLNNDDKFDYSLIIMTGRDSTLEEHFVALVSNGSKYDLYELKSIKVPDKNFSYYYTYINREHTYVANFGFDDDKIPRRFLNHTKGAGLYFNVDCITIIVRLQNDCSSFIYDKYKFIEFCSCD